jgi:hypothetical protein
VLGNGVLPRVAKVPTDPVGLTALRQLAGMASVTAALDEYLTPALHALSLGAPTGAQHPLSRLPHLVRACSCWVIKNNRSVPLPFLWVKVLVADESLLQLPLEACRALQRPFASVSRDFSVALMHSRLFPLEK